MPYKTKQRERIDALIENIGDRHFTADEADILLRQSGEAVGKATIYRHLERLVSEGRLRRFYSEDGGSACYQFIGDAHCKEHFHLKCMTCGRMIHLECSYLDELNVHLMEHHNFEVDNTKIVLCGTCGECRKK